MHYLTELERFRKDRNLTSSGDFITNILEELVEVRKAPDESNQIEETSDICVYCFNELAFTGGSPDFAGAKYKTGGVVSVNDLTEGVLFALDYTFYDDHDLRSIIDTCASFIEFKGYDFGKVMLETTKKINSRKGAYCEKAGKWQKQVDQDPSELYTPDYLSCKRG